MDNKKVQYQHNYGLQNEIDAKSSRL